MMVVADTLPEYIYPGYTYLSSLATTWLTADEKTMLVESLEAASANGTLDAGSIQPLRQLNALPGLASAFSCTGHRGEAAKKGGYLMLRTDRRIAEMLDSRLIDELWERGLIYFAEKLWQYASDPDGRPIPRVAYTLRFHVGYLGKICETVCQLIKES